MLEFLITQWKLLKALGPAVFDSRGPLGLEKSVAINILIGLTLMIVQVGFTYLIINLTLGRRSKKERLHDREDLGTEIVELYAPLSDKYAAWKKQRPSKNQQAYQDKVADFKSLMRRYDRVLEDSSERTNLRLLDDTYDAIVYDNCYDRMPEFHDRSQFVLQKLLTETRRALFVRTILRRGPSPWKRGYDILNEALEQLVKKLQTNTVPASDELDDDSEQMRSPLAA